MTARAVMISPVTASGAQMLLRKDIPDGNTPLTAFPWQPNLPPYSRPDSN